MFLPYQFILDIDLFLSVISPHWDKGLGAGDGGSEQEGVSWGCAPGKPYDTLSSKKNRGVMAN